MSHSADTGAYLESVQSCLKAIELDPTSSKAHTDLGLLYTRVGHLDEAEPELMKAIRLDPSNKATRAAIVEIMARRYAPFPAESEVARERARAIIDFLEELRNADNEKEQREDFAYLKKVLDEDRPSYRRRFED
ncbi:MAG TPA: tetratricopeptide repeat protein [Blastocatellia bacterium]